MIVLFGAIEMVHAEPLEPTAHVTARAPKTASSTVGKNISVR